MAKREETLNKKLLAAAVTATKVKEIKSLLDQGADIHTQNEWALLPSCLQPSTTLGQRVESSAGSRG
jgi:hypothetical protein